MAKEIKIQVQPSNNIFSELKKTSSDFSYKNALAEFIDNSIGAMVDGEVNVNIEVQGDWNEGNQKSLCLSDAKVVIVDDGCGIPFDKIGDALSPAGTANKKDISINEHGMGLKTALRNIGTTEKKDKFGRTECIVGFQIKTAPINSDKMYIINTLQYGEIIIQECEIDEKIFPKRHGTQIIIRDLDKVITSRKEYSRTVVPYLGQRYQLLLKGFHNKKVNINVSLIDKNGDVIKSKDKEMKYSVQSIEPMWSEQKPFMDVRLPIGKKDRGWSAFLKFGDNPSEGEMGLWTNDTEQYKNKTHPYYIGSSKFDIFFNDILICQKDLGWILDLEEVSVQRASRNRVLRGQLFLHSGFSSAFTKNDIQVCPHFCELKEAIENELRTKDYLTKEYQKKTRETFLKDDLEPILNNFYTDVKREVHLPYGYIADFTYFNPKEQAHEVCEVKFGEATAEDVAQLIAYLVLSPGKTGVLLAKSFNDNVKNFAQDSDGYLKNVNMKIKLLSVNNVALTK